MHRNVAAATGRTIVPLPDDPTDWALNTAGLERGEFITANCFVWRAVLEDTGGFDERYKRPWREDSDFQFTLLERGWRIECAPKMVVVHPVRNAPWGVSLKMQKNMLFDALLYKKYPLFYRTRISPHPPWRYYMVVIALFAGLLALAVGAHAVAHVFLGGWLAWTLYFTGRRLQYTSRRPSHVAEMLVTSAIIPPLAVFWRLAGAWKFRVAFA